MGLRDLTWFDVLQRNADAWAELPVWLFEGERITHRQAFTRAERLAGGLAAKGVGHGDRVAVLAQNAPAMMDVLGAVARLGAIALPVNWRLGAEEVAAILADGTPVIVIADASSLPLLEAARAALPAATYYLLDGTADGFEPIASLHAGNGAELPPDAASSDDPLLIIHTAAVEGRPRGAVLSHGNLISHNLQLAAAWRLEPSDVALGVLPLFHISGLGLAMATAQAGGATVIMRRFDGEAAARAIAAERVTVLCEFAPILGQILDAADTAGASLASLKAVWGLDSPETIARFEAACPGAAFWSGYGQSETSAYVSFAPHRERPGTAGRPAPLARLAILDEDDRPVPPGMVGEIAVRGPLVFQGYWNLPEATEWTFRGGWHHTGDMGRFDEDGFLVYAGRSPAKELIKTGGENVYPAEVEKALREHHAVAEAVVIGVPDARWGEAVKAVCELRPEAKVDEHTLVAFVGERIARYKRPKSIVLLEALPRLESGKPDRVKVKAEHGG
jgi:long-chain acyl-CoA synthetase